MNIEEQICSLEQAKKLKELGFKQESLFYYQNNPYNDGTDCMDIMIKERKPKNNENTIMNTGIENEDNPKYSAFTASELGEILPNGILSNTHCQPFNSYRILISKFISFENEKIINNYIINYECDSAETQGENAWLRRKLTSNIYDPNLSNAMGKMLIYLLENNLMELPK